MRLVLFCFLVLISNLCFADLCIFDQNGTTRPTLSQCHELECKTYGVFFNGTRLVCTKRASIDTDISIALNTRLDPIALKEFNESTWNNENDKKKCEEFRSSLQTLSHNPNQSVVRDIQKSNMTLGDFWKSPGNCHHFGQSLGVLFPGPENIRDLSTLGGAFQKLNPQTDFIQGTAEASSAGPRQAINPSGTAGVGGTGGVGGGGGATGGKAAEAR